MFPITVQPHRQEKLHLTAASCQYNVSSIKHYTQYDRVVRQPSSRSNEGKQHVQHQRKSDARNLSLPMTEETTPPADFPYVTEFHTQLRSQTLI